MYTTKKSLSQYGRTLGEERRRRGLSQRALGEIAGVTQGQISLIESGQVDPRLSTAIELSRALEMELTLVPRQRLSAVRAVIGHRTKEEAPFRVNRNWKQVLRVLRGKLAEEPERPDYARLYSLIRNLMQLEQTAPTSSDDRYALPDAARLLEYLNDKKRLDRLIALLEDRRNRIAHQMSSQPLARAVRPAYSLDQDQDV